MLKRMKLQKSWRAISLICLLSLTSCAHGPYVVECISNPKEANLHCYDYRASKSLNKLYRDVDGWVCLNPTDERNFLRACSQKTDGPQVNLCLVNYAGDEMRCFNQVTGQLNQPKLWETENYVCLQGMDFNAVLNYCLRARAENLQ